MSIKTTVLYKTLIVASVIAVILFSRFFPIYYASIHTPPGYVYVGQTSMYDPWDINVYVGAIHYGQDGHLFLKNQYSTKDNREAFIYPVYTIIGFLFRTVDPYTLYNAIAAITIIVVCLAIFALAFKILGNFFYSVIAMFLVTRGGGFGWLSFVTFGQQLIPADLAYSAVTFTSALQRAHEGIGTILLVLAIMSLYFYLQKQTRNRGIVSFLSVVFLMLFYPYYILSYAVIAGIYAGYFIFRKKNFKFLPLLTVNLAVSGIVIFVYYLNIKSSGFAVVMDENIDKVGFLSFLLAYGIFFFLFAIVYFLKRVNNQKQEQYFLITWIVTSVLLSYFPIGYSRLFLRGLFFPLVILSLILIRNMTSVLQRRVILIGFFLLMPLTSLFVFYSRIEVVDNRDSWSYIMAETDEMFDFLEARRGDGILSAYRYGNFIPAKTGKTVYFGHMTQTPDAKKRMQRIYEFYSGTMTNEEAREFLIRNHLTFVVYGLEERRLGGHVYPFLEQRFHNAKTQVYSL